MKKNVTELVFILDKSGSMAGLESDTIGGFNAMLMKQQNAEGEALVTTALFNHQYELLHDRLNVRGISPITESDYEVCGTTALLDAIGFTIQKIANVQKRTSEDERAEKVLFVITTDGMENASQEYSPDKIKKMVQLQKDKYGWEFMFLGANIDAVSTAAEFGIDEDFAVEYHADHVGTQLNYAAVNEAVLNLRSGKKIDRSWKEGIEKDYHQRTHN
ncbi:VWA domain-containing protein [Neobacillus sp. MM2021_6]|uniref:vWA domain-containing protein n=1 Tax=Bacillaceae TaxID=186817 RepID=UPI001408E941|nr:MULTISPECIES: VWA domain-containing protein [Bacillaceae]MBO0962259.1 VWA domain-containing protein [Neobacillus sp. MM2021_6]NHC19408.1 VWA domain-containing protein [Bacillus sp. MM2020_4]